MISYSSHLWLIRPSAWLTSWITLLIKVTVYCFTCLVCIFLCLSPMSYLQFSFLDTLLQTEMMIPCLIFIYLKPQQMCTGHRFCATWCHIIAFTFTQMKTIKEWSWILGRVTNLYFGIESQERQKIQKTDFIHFLLYFHHCLCYKMCVFSSCSGFLAHPALPVSFFCSFVFPSIHIHCLLSFSSWTYSSALRNMKHTGGFDVYLSSEFQVQSNTSEIRWQNGLYYIGMH